MTSDRKSRANRCNAKKSTGPRSEKGKARSALNAVSHGLSGQPVYDAPTQETIEGLAHSFAAGEFSDDLVMACAREAAEAQVLVTRIKQARRMAWESAAEDMPITDRGNLVHINTPDMARAYDKGSDIAIDDLKRLMPYLFAQPFENDIERDAAIVELASKRLFSLIRYERSAANCRDKALRKMEQIRDESG